MYGGGEEADPSMAEEVENGPLTTGKRFRWKSGDNSEGSFGVLAGWSHRLRKKGRQLSTGPDFGLVRTGQGSCSYPPGLPPSVPLATVTARGWRTRADLRTGPREVLDPGALPVAEAK